MFWTLCGKKLLFWQKSKNSPKIKTKKSTKKNKKRILIKQNSLKNPGKGGGCDILGNERTEFLSGSRKGGKAVVVVKEEGSRFS